MMTRRDFQNIAVTLNANHAPQELVLDFADMLEEENPRFDRARFIDASTVAIRAIASSRAAILRGEGVIA